MFAVPYLSLNYIGGNDALGIFLIHLVALAPLTSVINGVLGGWGEKVQWYIPLINSVIFLISFIIITGFDLTYVICAAIYFGIGIAAAYITKAIRTKKNKTEIQ